MEKQSFPQLSKLRRFMKQLAVMATVLLIVALVLKLIEVHYSDDLLIVGFGTLAIVALFLGKIYPAPADTPMQPIWNFAMRNTGYSLAVLMIGALFALMHWPGSKVMLVAGAIALLACGAAWLFYIIRKNRQ